MTDFQYLARGIALAGCGIGAGCALIAGIGPGIGEGNAAASKVLKVSHKFCPPKKFLFWEMPL